MLAFSQNQAIAEGTGHKTFQRLNMSIKINIHFARLTISTSRQHHFFLNHYVGIYEVKFFSYIAKRHQEDFMGHACNKNSKDTNNKK